MVVFKNAQQAIASYLSENSFSQVFVLVDENTEKHCLPVITDSLPKHQVITIPAGEEHKNIKSCEYCWQQLLQLGADRNTLLINIGGGVVTDLGGFVAGCYKRGIQFMNIPTSLLAMVDASVGSKTGIDFGTVKNAIGLFNDAELVIIDTQFLQTLPQRHFKNGQAEILKHGLIADHHHFHQFLQMGDDDDFEPIIRESVKIKQQIVEQDPTEAGLRKILNFGHTLGHAIESYSVENEEDYLLHGEAIAMGMIAEIYLSQKFTNFSAADAENCINSIKNYFTIRQYSENELQQMLVYLKNDKKNQANAVNYSLLQHIGEATYNIEVTEEDALWALQQMQA